MDVVEAVAQACERGGLGPLLARPLTRVIIKPNLVNDSPPPVTSPPDAVFALADWIAARCDARLIIAEGCGTRHHETDELYALHGYAEPARQRGIELVDLNHAPCVAHEAEGCEVYPTMYLPELLVVERERTLLISVAVCKAHSLAEMTGVQKNMLGVLPPAHYGGTGGFAGTWRKAATHTRMQASIRDLMRHCAPDFSLLDARRALARYHLGGPEISPPPDTLLAAGGAAGDSSGALAVDRAGARLLGLDPDRVGHLRWGGRG